MTLKALDLAAVPVRQLAPYVPGKPLSELEREYGVTDSIKLASNENPLGPGPKARAAIARSVQSLGLYPDGNGFELKQALASKHGCALEQITLGNGSNDLLVMLAEAFLSAEVEAVYSQYCFAIYPIVVQATGAVARVASAYPESHAMALGHDLDAMFKLVNARTRLVFIANPNNPTGTWVDAVALKRFIAAVPDTTLVVVDEAYIEYVQDDGFAAASLWLDEFPNLIVTRTFSKAYGLAGLRVGYALSQGDVAGVLNRVRQPFNVNSVALSAAIAALDDAEHLQQSVQLNTRGMQQVTAGLKSLGLRVYSSKGNFVLVDCARPGGAVYEALLRQGVIVRPVGGYGLPTQLRITIGTEQENARMLAALQTALK
ncbi:MAG: histidinol-phosphate transaminase [Steroidobacteraceae bacterium]